MPRWLLVLALCLSVARHACAFDASHDSHPLTQGERENFIALACEHPFLKDDSYHCDRIKGRPDPDPGYDGGYDVTLTSIAYGAFTRAGADQAYVGYQSSFESHATNGGGIILFERANGGWKIVRWYSGLQMDACLAIPATGAQKMLCHGWWMGQGEMDSALWEITIPAANDDDSISNSLHAVLKAQDDRQTMTPDYTCRRPHTSDQGVLLDIETPQHAQNGDFFAQSSITYATPQDFARACKAKHFDKVKESKATVFFTIKDGGISVVNPLSFVSTDY